MYKIAVGIIPEIINRYKTPDLSYKEGLSEKIYSDASLAGRLLLLNIMNYLNLPEISYGINGKPFFRDENMPWFNISHSCTHAAAILSDEGPVGCDIEVIRPRENWIRLARSVFSDEECNAVIQGTPEDNITEFWYRWTQKEAILKQRGGDIFQLPYIDSINISPKVFLKTYSCPDFILSICTPTTCNTLRPMRICRNTTLDTWMNSE
ncbi:4'-phosphopantetheinyl transferase superfamily protein [Enterobacter asburiae]|uniref:4'-phosphopantetheinyl transferase superfamily protein n=1 Tax=Enterobacter asburiae TaxID=61645 RepID=UPI0011D1A632|nr:4'-phosphopantetheinyl transferase superfamily protein [Enterobacter asburiae]